MYTKLPVELLAENNFHLFFTSWNKGCKKSQKTTFKTWYWACPFRPQTLIKSDGDQNLLSKFTNTTSDSGISDQRLRSKGQPH